MISRIFDSCVRRTARRTGEDRGQIVDLLQPAIPRPERLGNGTAAAWLLATLFIAICWSQPALACAGPHCDPNWAFQNQMNAQRAEEQRMMEAHRRQMDMYYGGQGSSSGAQAPAPLPEPPVYRPPPPPRGWQPRFTGFVTYKVGEDEDRDPARFRHDYAIAMNFDSADEAKAAAAKLCRARVLRSWETHDIDYMCEQQSHVYRDAFLTLVTFWNGTFGLYEQPTQKLAITQHGYAFDIGDHTYYCNDPARPGPDTCQSRLLGLGLNGLHPDRGPATDYRIFPCPNGSPDRLHKVIGVDRLSGSDVPLCGPDLSASTVQERSERWDAYAVHPRYLLPFAAGGFVNLELAQKAVTDMCNRLTGGGCKAVGHHKNGYAVWVRNEEGRLFLGVGHDELAAVADGQRKCGSGHLLPCKTVLTRITGDLRVYGPRNKSGDLRYYGAVALPGGKVGEDRKAWVAQNMETQDVADRSALQACESGNRAKRSCAIVARGLGTRFFAYVGLDGSKGIFPLVVRGANALIDPENREAEMLKKLCSARGTTCRTIGALDAGDDGEGQQPNIATLEWPLP